ncbi:MAG TPA: hypothetical protein VGM82_00270 [Gemmatimonadaceae bacterium]|jgi:hypothetical protein
MILRRFTLALFAIVLATPIAAQSVGISVAGFGNGVAADFIRTEWGPSNAVRLSAVVLWRGSSDWTSNHGAAELGLARLDSVRAESERRGAIAGAMVTATASAWVEYDAANASVLVLGQSYPIGKGDSTTVVLAVRASMDRWSACVEKDRVLLRS